MKGRQNDRRSFQPSGGSLWDYISKANHGLYYMPHPDKEATYFDAGDGRMQTNDIWILIYLELIVLSLG